MAVWRVDAAVVVGSSSRGEADGAFIAQSLEVRLGACRIKLAGVVDGTRAGCDV